MNKFIICAFISILFSTCNSIADNIVKPIDEKGLSLKGNCKAIASSPDGYTYVLMSDKRLIRIDCDGEQKEFKIPLLKEIKTADDYFCDMAVDTKAAYFCGYNYSSIQTLDLNNPNELKSLNISHNNKPINPMMINKNIEGWTIKDFDLNTYKIDKTGHINLLPPNSELILDRFGKAIIQEAPSYNEKGEFCYSSRLLKEDGSVQWIASQPDAPMRNSILEYLGYDADQSRDIYLVNSTSGDIRTEITIYAVDKNNKIIAKKNIPNRSLNFIVRFCKLASDGSILAVYADYEKPEENIILKKFELNQIEVPSKG